MIEQRSLRSLEWERLTGYLAEQAETAEGKQRALTLEPGELHDASLSGAATLLDQTEEACALIASRTAFSLVKLADVREPLALLKAGAVIAAQELSRIKSLLVVARSVRASLNLLVPAQFPHLYSFVERLVALPKQIEIIDFAVDDHGNVKDSASSLLRSLRRDRLKLDASIKDELSRIIQSQAGSKALQESIYTMRDGRFVVPVMASMRYMMDGIVHDASQSGLTVYVEPISVVELSNQVRIKDAAIESEIQRIVKDLCAELTPHAEAMQFSYRALIDLDCIMSRARLGLLYGGTKPELSAAPLLELRQARHPLLVLQNIAMSQGNKKVIANTVLLSFGERTLVITGPNTGGKTVLLKLIGLYALMVRCGLLLPVANGSKTALFSPVCADIGDEQSLEQSLSTFSAHMKNVVEIVDQAGPGMLVLLDEIGAGTDPKEGAALARAVLEHLVARGAITIATTHLGELKMLAYSNGSFVNASFEFDENSLSPTYRLRLGIPGSSKANTIAQRLGLADDVIARARQLTEANDQELEQIIENLNSRLDAVGEKERGLQKIEAQLEHRAGQLEEKANKIAMEQDKLKGRLASELEDELKAAREITKEMIASLQRSPSINAAQKSAAELETLKNTVSFLKERQKPLPRKGPDPDVLAEGMTVRLRSLNNTGIVQEIFYADKQQNKIDKVIVQVGPLKVKVAPEDLEIRGSAKVKLKSVPQNQYQNQKQKKGANKVTSPDFSDAPVFVRTQFNTLDLRGMRVDEAQSQLETFVDSCAVDQVSPLMVIHGHGTGAIKSVVRDFFSHSQYPNRYRSGENFEGGDGVTIVDLGS